MNPLAALARRLRRRTAARRSPAGDTRAWIDARIAAERDPGRRTSWRMVRAGWDVDHQPAEPNRSAR